MFRALDGPILITPTWLYFAGVPGAEKPRIQFTPAAGALDDTTAKHPNAPTTAISPRSRTVSSGPRSLDPFSPPLGPRGRVFNDGLTNARAWACACAQAEGQVRLRPPGLHG